MALDNDTRGWIMAVLSGLACLFGAALICVDLFIRRIPGRRNFKIENSNGFLSASLSLSFGVMFYSALAKMLPSASKSLQEGGLTPKAASFVQIGLFIAGAIGIQVVSRVMHHFLPHHVVDCDHTHEEEEEQNADELESCPGDEESMSQISHRKPSVELIRPISSASTNGTLTIAQFQSDDLPTQAKPQWTRLLSANRVSCDANGQCYGYTDPCGFDCFRNLQARSESSFSRPILPRSASTTDMPRVAEEHTPLLQDMANGDVDPAALRYSSSTLQSSRSSHHGEYEHDHDHDHEHSHDHDHNGTKSHHHHVPTNAFLSIGLQTSIAIGLHKIPEGFITYATNHANPKLGVAVFISLFIHNITEGFALALPLYLALRSRAKAIAWSALLGCLSQPLGAGIAAAWFKIAGSTNMAPGEAVYGGMFAIVAGIMANVGLQLMGEAWDLTHHKNMCIIFAFLGMGILGLSSALTA